MRHVEVVAALLVAIVHALFAAEEARSLATVWGAIGHSVVIAGAAEKCAVDG